MSQHIVIDGYRKFVFGWDQSLQSFYLQVHDMLIPEDNEDPPRIGVWLGADKDSSMYEVHELVRAAKKHGLIINYPTIDKLFGEKDDGV